MILWAYLTFQGTTRLGGLLIVDDEYASRETLQSVLEGEGYQLEMAENGMQRAVEALRMSSC
jgi:CheY-like chemotaxis protein